MSEQNFPLRLVQVDVHSSLWELLVFLVMLFFCCGGTPVITKWHSQYAVHMEKESRGIIIKYQES